MKVVFIILAISILLAAILLASGCNVLKAKSSHALDSTSVSKTDTGFLKKTQSQSVTDWEWFKTTFQYTKPQKLDTSINNFYSSTPQPQVIIVEGGKGKQEINTSTYDSGWQKRFDSLALLIKNSSKTKETEVLTWKHLVAFGILIIVAFLLILWLSKFKIVKRINKPKNLKYEKNYR